MVSGGTVAMNTVAADSVTLRTREANDTDGVAVRVSVRGSDLVVSGRVVSGRAEISAAAGDVVAADAAATYGQQFCFCSRSRRCTVTS